MRAKDILIPVAAAIVFGAGGFLGGIQYQKTKVPTISANGNFSRADGSRSAGSPGTARNGGGITSGQIISRDDKSITLKMQNGSTKVVYYTNATKVTKNTPGTPNDLITGANVLANGTANSDGSIAAANLQIR